MGLSTCRRTLTPSKTPGADGILHDDLGETGRALNVTEADLDEARAIARTFTFDDTQRVRGIAPVWQIWFHTHHLIAAQLMAQVHKQHSRDPNFPIQIIDKIEHFLSKGLQISPLPS